MPWRTESFEDFSEEPGASEFNGCVWPSASICNVSATQRMSGNNLGEMGNAGSADQSVSDGKLAASAGSENQSRTRNLPRSHCVAQSIQNSDD